MTVIQSTSPEGVAESLKRPIYTGQVTADEKLLIVDDLGSDDDDQPWIESDVWWDEVR